jgi:hypothetical protein
VGAVFTKGETVDIVSELRSLPEPQCRPCKAAADEIERLRDQIEKMRAVISADHHRAAPVSDRELREFHRRLMAMGGIPGRIWEE